MNKTIEWFLIPLFFIMSVLCAFNSLCHSHTELKKVYHHTHNNDMYLECGNISCYFSHEPQVTVISDYSFFFPCSVKSNECNEMIQRVNTHKSDTYKISMKKVITPQQGIQITFTGDPQKVAISYELFDSIGMQKGIVFHVYNKELLRILHEKNNQPILRTLSRTQKPSIIIDPGHGGYDSGAVGVNDITEKMVCLGVSKKLAHLLQIQGYDVCLTRDDDRYLFLDERTFLAHQKRADLFVSIHANYARDAHAQGIETFCLHQPLFKECFSILLPEERQQVMHYIQNKISVSHKIALSIQNHLCGDNYKQDDCFKQPHNRQVKNAVSQVLLGTQMPAVLIEIGFLSHPEEVLLLNSEQYQHFLAQRIADGVVAGLFV